jgi:hypothetical protein
LNLYVYIGDPQCPVLGIQVFIDEVLALDNGSAWVGFAARTRDAWEHHDILNWAYRQISPE